MPKENITQRGVDYNQWYLDIVREADMAEVAEVVRGCIVFKPTGWAVWEMMQRQLDDRIKETGHSNVYFPLLIPKSFIMREADHVEDAELGGFDDIGGQIFVLHLPHPVSDPSS